MSSNSQRYTDLGWPDLLQRLVELCHTAAGQQCARELRPLQTADQVREMLELVAEARALHAAGEPPPFGQIWQLGPAIRRLDKEGVLAGATLVEVGQTLEAFSRLRRFLLERQAEAPRLAAIAESLADLEHVWGPIADAFDESGQLADHASAQLGTLRAKVAELNQRLARGMRTLLESPALSNHLQDRFYTQREDRYVLPIKASSGHAVDGIVLGSSSSGATIFVEPRQMVALNNQLKVSEMEVQREEARILGELSGYVGEELPAIERSLEVARRIDLIDARARLALRMKASMPRIAEDGTICLRALRHPLMALSGVTVVPNDLELAAAHTLIISGPNAGGKTVCLKALGLSALMLRVGLHLPTDPESCLPLFGQVLTDIGDDQSIENNLSTFTAHLRHVLDFTARADGATLVLLDEVATGTDPSEGEALAQALLEGLAATGAQVVVTTHYERLKALPLSDARFTNASVGFDLERLNPTYRLHLGTPGSSFALRVARKSGLAAEAAQRAQALLSVENSDLSQLLADLAGQQSALEAQRAAAAAAEDQALQLQQRLRHQLEQLRRQGRAEVQRLHGQALDDLKRARRQLARVNASLRQPLDRDQAAQADRSISEAAALLREHEPQRDPPPSEPVTPADLTPGDEVYVPGLGGLAVVDQVDPRGRLMVRVGALRSLVEPAEVRRPTRSERRSARPRRELPAEGAVRPSDELAKIPVRTPDITLDARGMRVDEAIRETDRFLDRGLLDDRDVLFILHGHGSGRLRAALRQHLGQSPMVRQIRAADRAQGGDAVTVVWLR